AALEREQRTSYSHSILLADLALKENNVALAQVRLKECKPELRNWEWRYLDAQCHTELFSFPGITATFSPNGSRLAVGGTYGLLPVGDGTVRVYDVRTGQEVLSLKGPARLSDAVFSPDGSRIAVTVEGGRDGIVRIYDTGTGQETLSLKEPAPLRNPVFSPDGSRIAAVGGDGLVRIYNGRTGQETLCLKGHANRGLRVAFSPDGSRIAVTAEVGRDSIVRNYNA